MSTENQGQPPVNPNQVSPINPNPSPAMEEGKALGNEAPVASKAGTPTGQIASTLDSLSELRVKVAELCGYERWETANKERVWLCKPRDEAQRQYWLSCGDSVTDKPITFDCTNIPDFCNDLNACAEFEKRLTHKQRISYYDYIYRDCMIGEVLEFGFRLVNYPPEQRCLAFVALHEEKK